MFFSDFSREKNTVGKPEKLMSDAFPFVAARGVIGF